MSRKDLYVGHLVNHFKKHKISTPSKTEEKIPEDLKPSTYNGPPRDYTTPINI